MKKNYFLLLLCVALSVTSMSAAKKVAYVTRDKAMADGAAPVDNDQIIQYLNGDSEFAVTVFKTDASGIDVNTSAPVDLTGFDVIVGQETYGSGDAVWKTGNPLYLGSLTAPTLYNKVYALRAGKAFTTSAGVSADATEILNLAIAAGQESNPIFNGIAATGGVFPVVKSPVTDTGGAGTKVCQFNTGNVLSASNTLLAYPEGSTAATLAVSDLPAGSSIDDVASLPFRVITMNFNYGTLVKDNGTNLTTEGLTLWRNAIYVLAGLTPPTTPAEMPSGVNEINYSADIISVDYYTINGAQVKEPTKGIFIKKTSFKNGSVKLDKVVFVHEFSK